MVIWIFGDQRPLGEHPNRFEEAGIPQIPAASGTSARSGKELTLTACCSACESSYAPLHAARSPACNARPHAHANRTLADRNLPESPTPLGFILAAPQDLTACCSACASAHAPLAARSPACNARSPAHANRSIGQRSPAESTGLLAPLMELRTCDSDCARPPGPYYFIVT